ncbi:hypothetical protein LTR37_001967 [Vermiconidia calcicola]|uniref:Uncharacterized protein n=1 Tax=Vermiconidia calcicola TaxID=1690605 RepID=A0ACC3NUN4_9PEZI|nr:hypothetical protein LTR37_001967 [Vermiconidia calcicola]
MTPADLAMKSALYESARYAQSPPSVPSEAGPLLTRQHESNVTSSEPRTPQLPEHVGPSLKIPTTPHTTYHQFRKHQDSPGLSSSSTLDYKRVRRKRPSSNLSSGQLHTLRGPALTTSLPSSLHSTSPQTFHPSLLPPFNLTPILRPSTSSPSLSSTVDTLPSTPTYSPIEPENWPFQQWRSGERLELVEPVRTKRKFAQFKAAKRLPHYTALHNGADGIWEVHAAVIDVGDGYAGDQRDFGEGTEVHVTEDRNKSTEERDRLQAETPSSARKGRSVRFEGIATDSSNSDTERSRISKTGKPSKDNDPTLSSSYSLSKFKFPAPPGYAWTDTFGHLTEPTDPASPATLHYKGASFDVVNPHASLLLGNNNLETPAEIDGLLDDYFHSREDLASMAYTDRAGEFSTSQNSLQTSSSNGRQRMLYDDPESARRNILRIQSARSQQTAAPSPYDDSPPLRRNDESQLSFARNVHSRPATPLPFQNMSGGGTPGTLHLHPSLREALSRGPESTVDDGFETVPLEGVDDTIGRARSTAGNGSASARVGDRGSSVYPPSQRSNPFDLTLSDIDDNDNRNSVAERDLYYAGDGGYYNREEIFAVYEDANTTQSTLEPETTVGNIISHYHDVRQPSTYPDSDANARQGDDSTSSPVEAGRTRLQSQNPFLAPWESSEGSAPPTASYGTSGLMSRLESPPTFSYGRPDPPRAQSRMAGPPPVAPPTPRLPNTEGGTPSYYPSGYTDLPTTEQTYGNTGQLLNLTPQGRIQWPFHRSTDDAPPGQRGERPIRPAHGQTYSPRGVFATTSTPRYHEDENKENSAPHAIRAGDSLMSLRHTPRFPSLAELPSYVRFPSVTYMSAPRAMPRSSSYYPDDDDAWESTQASESRANLAERNADVETEHIGDVGRTSQDSYADRSVAGSTNRFSLPREPVPVTPRIPPIDQQTRQGQSHTVAQRNVRREGPRTVRSNEEIAQKILEDKILEDTVLTEAALATPRRDQTQYTADMKELERLRRNDPTAVQKATAAVAEQIGRMKMSELAPIYSPQQSLARARNVGPSRLQRGGSETEGLLNEPQASPSTSGALQFSETANTFQTARRRPHPLATNTPVTGYSPLLTPPPVTPPATAFFRDRSETATTRADSIQPTPESPYTANIELKPLRKKKRVARAVMSSQTELRPLTLADSTAASANGGRLTDAQLINAEPGWTTRPDIPESSPTARVPRNSIPTSFAIRQADGTMQEVSLLMRPDQARNMATRHRQQKLTKPYFRWCIICPITALYFGCGGLDFKMREVSEGKIEEMSPTAKKTALRTYVPLGTILYAAVGLMVAMIVISARH